jgi:chromosome segregation ATPase
MEAQEGEDAENEIKNDIKSTKAYNILVSLHEDHIIEEDAYNKYLKKLIKIQDCIVNYMEFEKLLDKRLNALKEENTKTLNEYAFLSKQQNDLNDKISKKLEEREQAKSQLTEYETNRALKSNYDIERNQEEIAKLKQAIKENEDKQMAQLMKELKEIEDENQQKKDEIKKLLDDIVKEEENFKKLTSLKEKLEFEKKKTEKEIGDLNSNIETKMNQIENDNRTNKLNADAKKRLEDEIKKKGLNLEQIVRDNKKLVAENNSFIEKIKQLDEQSKKLYEQKNNLEKEFNQRENENKLLDEKITSDSNKRAFFELEKKRKQKN